MVKDSIDVALDLDEKAVYSHVAHESALDLMRIISSIDAERASLRGEVIYFEDDWDELIRRRIERGRRHTAFDFYNPELLNKWEEKVNRLKVLKKTFLGVNILFPPLMVVAVVIMIRFLYFVFFVPLILFLYYWARHWLRERMDLVYYEMAQYFIDEMAHLLSKFHLNPSDYQFKLFHWDYQGVKKVRQKNGIFAEVLPKFEDNR